MKLEDHVEKIRIKVEEAVKNTLDRCGISDAVPLMKDYMESGSFSRGGKGGEISGNASIIYNGNINQPVETVLQNSHLFSPMSSEVNNDTAFLDRVNAYLPGWEIKKFAPSNFTTHFGFSTDFFSELLKGLRKDTYYEVVDEFFSLGSHLKQRDAKSVRRIVSGYIKLLHPDGNFTNPAYADTFLRSRRYCIYRRGDENAYDGSDPQTV